MMGIIQTVSHRQQPVGGGLLKKTSWGGPVPFRYRYKKESKNSGRKIIYQPVSKALLEQRSEGCPVLCLGQLGAGMNVDETIFLISEQENEGTDMIRRYGGK